MKPVTPEKKSKPDDRETHFSVGSEDLTVDFVRDAVGRIYVSIFQKGPAHSVEVSLHKFFGGVVTETFEKEEFRPDDVGLLLIRYGFPADRFADFVDNKAKVSVRFV